MKEPESNSISTSSIGSVRFDESFFHGIPAEQPKSLADIANRLFAPYTIENGTVKVAGCTLEDRPIFKVDHDGEKFFDESLNRIDEDFVKTLVNESTNQPSPPTSLSPNRATTLIEMFVKESHQRQSNFTIMAVYWCKWISGKLIATIGEVGVEIPFSGWANRLANGPDRMPPYRCELTNATGYRLMESDDHEISVAEGLDHCSVSNRFVTKDKLFYSDVSELPALIKFARECSVSGDRCIENEIVTCRRCEQPISTKTQWVNSCLGCGQLIRLEIADEFSDLNQDPTLSGQAIEKLFAEYPRLQRFKKRYVNWTKHRNYFEFVGVLKKYLFVQDVSTGKILLAKNAFRWSSNYQTLSQDKLRQLFGN